MEKSKSKNMAIIFSQDIAKMSTAAKLLSTYLYLYCFRHVMPNAELFDGGLRQ